MDKYPSLTIGELIRMRHLLQRAKRKEKDDTRRLATAVLIGCCDMLIVDKDKTIIDDGVYDIIKKVSMDCLPSMRTKILKALWERSGWQHEWMKTREVAQQVEFPTITTKQYLEDLHMLRLCEMRHVQEGADDKTPYEWKLNEGCKLYLQGTGVLGVGAKY